MSRRPVKSVMPSARAAIACLRVCAVWFRSAVAVNLGAVAGGDDGLEARPPISSAPRLLDLLSWAAAWAGAARLGGVRRAGLGELN